MWLIEQVEKQLDKFQNRIEEDSEIYADRIQAWRQVTLQQGCLFLLVLPILISVFFYDASLVMPVFLCYASLSLLLEGYNAQRTQFGRPCRGWRRRPLTGEDAKRQGSTQIVVGIIMLMLSFWCLVMASNRVVVTN